MIDSIYAFSLPIKQVGLYRLTIFVSVLRSINYKIKWTLHLDNADTQSDAYKITISTDMNCFPTQPQQSN